MAVVSASAPVRKIAFVSASAQNPAGTVTVTAN
jgi:hypothetical protein